MRRGSIGWIQRNWPRGWIWSEWGADDKEPAVRAAMISISIIRKSPCARRSRQSGHHRSGSVTAAARSSRRHAMQPCSSLWWSLGKCGRRRWSLSEKATSRLGFLLIRSLARAPKRLTRRFVSQLYSVVLPLNEFKITAINRAKGHRFWRTVEATDLLSLGSTICTKGSHHGFT